MRILKLTPQTEKALLAKRARQDAEAYAVAAEIVQDVRKRGDIRNLHKRSFRHRRRPDKARIVSGQVDVPDQVFAAAISVMPALASSLIRRSWRVPNILSERPSA